MKELSRFSRSCIGNMEEIIVGVVGVLQFDVLKYPPGE